MNNAVTIEGIFQGRLLHVPDYQRSYAWTAKQLDDFIEDLDLLRDGKDHYTGTIVLDRREEEAGVLDRKGQSYETFDIVDGQQRLTTVVLLLDAIRREFKTMPDFESIAEGMETAYVRSHDLTGAPLPKLKLNAETQAFFMSVVLSDAPKPDAPTNIAQQRLVQARDRFVEYLTKQRVALGVGYGEWLLRLYKKVTTRLLLVLYEVTDSAEVGVIFEVMNDRGRPLTELEKVKNYLLYLANKVGIENNGLADEVNRTWARIFQRLLAADLSGTSDEDQLLRSHWLMAYDWVARNWAGTASVKDLLGLRRYQGDDQTLLEQARKYVDSLDRASLAYCEIMNPTRPGAFAAMASGATLSRLVGESARFLRLRATATFLPLLMAARLRYPMESQPYRDVLSLCERFAFRVYRLRRYRANAGQSGLYRAGNRLFGGDRGLEETIRDVTGYLLYYSPNKQYQEELSETKDLDWYRWSGLRYFLYEYEEHLAHDKEVLLPWNVVEKRELEKTIEHILPQTPTDAYWLERFTDAERAELTNDIGNLCLTEDNSSYSNKPFPGKRGSAGLKDGNGRFVPCYANSVLFQERALAGHENWRPLEIQARRSEILGWARQRWAVADGVPDVEIDETEDEE